MIEKERNLPKYHSFFKHCLFKKHKRTIVIPLFLDKPKTATRISHIMKNYINVKQKSVIQNDVLEAVQDLYKSGEV